MKTTKKILATEETKKEFIKTFRVPKGMKIAIEKNHICITRVCRTALQKEIQRAESLR